MKSSQRESSSSYEKDEAYIRELNYLQEWFDYLLPMLEQINRPSPPYSLLKISLAFIIEVLLYNFFYLNRQTYHKLIDFLGRPNFTSLFPKEYFPSLANVIDLQTQLQPLSASQTNTWEKFSENLRISTVIAYGTCWSNIYDPCRSIDPDAITNRFNETVGNIYVSPIEKLKTRLNFQTQDTLTKYVSGLANSQSYTLSAMEKKRFKGCCMTAEAQDPKEFKKVFQLKTSEIRLSLEEKSRFPPLALENWWNRVGSSRSSPPLLEEFWLKLNKLKNWWNRDSIMMSDLTIRVIMLCGLAEDQSILSLREQVMLEQLLLQIKEEIKAKISAQKNKWLLRKLGSNNALDLQLKNLITRVTKIEKLHLKKDGEQGDRHGTMTGCSVDSDLDSDLDLDLDDEPSAQLITENTVTIGSPPRLLPTMMLAQQLFPDFDLLPQDNKTGAVQPQPQPQQQKQQVLNNTPPKENQPAALNTPLKKSAQPQLTQSNHMSKTELAERQVKRPMPNKSLEPAFKRRPPGKNPNTQLELTKIPTRTKPYQVKPIVTAKAPANVQVSKSPSRAELTALKALNIYELRQKAEQLNEQQRMNNIQPTVFQAEAGAILVHL